MELQFIELGKLVVSKTNMRYRRQAPDVADILPTVRKRGVIVPVLVRRVPAPDGGMGGSPETFEIVAGARRFTAASIVADERREAGQDVEPMPCAILSDSDDADAIEASLIENVARLDADEVTQWETFTRLVKEGRDVADLSATFGIPELGVKRILALGNLMPRIRTLYRSGEIDPATVRHLTMASKSQQRAWLALFDDAEAYVPTGHQLKAWLFGGQSIPVKHALFDCEGMNGIVSDLFGEDRYFADADTFWTAQSEAIQARRGDYLDAGWPDVVIVPQHEYFSTWEYEKAPKRKGGRVYIDVRSSGEVTFHEGYITRLEARRLAKGEAIDTGRKPPRPEVTGTMLTYIDLHRHAAVRAALTARPNVALRLMVAHAIVGSPLWTVKPEPQWTRNDWVRESIETCKAETDFDEKRRAVLAVLGFSPDEPTVTGGNGDGVGLVSVFLRLLELPDLVVMDVIALVMGETLSLGSAAVEAVGQEIGVDMARYWQADDAFLELLRDKEVLTRIVADVAGETVASANAGEKTKTLKAIIRNHLAGTEGRTRIEGWVPKWMTFPPDAYTSRGGVGTVEKAASVAAARNPDDPDPADPGTVAGLLEPQSEAAPEREAA
ncbi:ParB/RepB/Spo0J family partition protein [Stakelama sediminis]|uniref:ParB family chromosome partitioning protein n=1 Tax=Stakelama sediminis TaxID=463200 RepID=A0A840Z369_9SPHN|nr:ParB N-terminal domain-containing protein [Stakelama sediminis]MBB5720204.1 ParB family chromosome partitioning protein [Stakelama sediminis]